MKNVAPLLSAIKTATVGPTVVACIGSAPQRHRLAPNYQQLPVNRSKAIVRNVNQEGLDDHGHTKGDINYEPSAREPQGPLADPGLSISHRIESGPATQESLKGPQDFR
jgi:catalase